MKFSLPLRCSQCINRVATPPTLAIVGEWRRWPGEPLVLIRESRVSSKDIDKSLEFPIEPPVSDNLANATYRRQLRNQAWRNEALSDLLGVKPKPITSPNYVEGCRKEMWLRNFYSEYYSRDGEEFTCGRLWSEVYLGYTPSPRTRTEWAPLKDRQPLICSQGHFTMLSKREALRHYRKAIASGKDEVFI